MEKNGVDIQTLPKGERVKSVRAKDYSVFKIWGDSLLALSTGEVYRLDPLAEKILRAGYKSPEEAMKSLSVGVSGESLSNELGGEFLSLGVKGASESSAGVLWSGFSAEEIERVFYEMKEIFANPPRDHSQDEIKRELRALCLNITHRCNLACEYCFARDLTLEGKKSMSRDVVESALVFLFRASGDVKRLQVDFFGGEPLLAWDEVVHGIEYARKLEKEYNNEKKVLFTLTTNAVLLDKRKIEFLKGEKVSLILSLDGPRKIHDVNRKHKNGSGSFDDVIKNIKLVQSMMDADDFYIRGTFSGKTLDILEILRYYHGEGFYNVSLEPVSGGTGETSLGEEELEELLENYRQSARWMLDKDIQFFHFNLSIDNPLCLSRRITGCGAGVEYMAVSPDGNLYPCHRFVETGNFLMGNVYSGIEKPQIAEKLHESTLYSKKGCSDCWGRFYCGGGCHFQQWDSTGDIEVPSEFYCELFLSRLETALWFNYKKQEK